MDAYRDGQLNPDAASTPYDKTDYDCMYCYQRDANAHIILLDSDADDPLMVCGACMAAFAQGQAHPTSTLNSILSFLAGERKMVEGYPTWFITAVFDTERALYNINPIPIAEATQ